MGKLLREVNENENGITLLYKMQIYQQQLQT